MDRKNKSLSQHVELTNAALFKNNEPIAVESINKNQPTVSKPVCLSNKTLHSSAGDDNAISSLNAQLGTETVDLRLNTTRQYLHLYAGLIRNWANQWKANRKLIMSKHGKHAKIKSLTHNKQFRLSIEQYLEENKFSLSIPNFINYIENITIPAFRIIERTTISRSTACRWLNLLGWKYKGHSKTIYFDGHERENLEHAILPRLSYGVREIVLVTHDKTPFYANNSMHKVWGPKDESMLHNKSQELSMHVSNFICQSIERLKLSEYERRINDLLPDDSHLKLKHTKTCVIIYPGSNWDALFMFDNRSNHGAFANNALMVSQMNMSDGTKMPLLHNNTKPDGSIHVMTYIDDKDVVRPKDIRRVLEESDLKNPKCCATCILAAQPNFASQQSRIREVIEAADHMCIFYPKFHCELNYIESFWAEAKHIAKLNCDYTFRSLKRAVLRALNSVDIIKIRHFAHCSECFMSAYKLGLSGKAAAFAVKKYHSHRRIPEKVLKEFAHD
ncbi:5056_t:CDS:2 [Cetraspora pellucida]|uniref:5056_t:CDS:1 n=1 Tax=Cetraspora pellucida TaxID=1433469 RepID=A0A9N8ZAF0_9GLOM|nr:5056_t:CDS:2 [Cetraspora pellucida]